MKFVTRFKKVIMLVGVGTGVSFFWTSGLMAQTGDAYLQQIAANTKGILEEVNHLPNYFENIVKAATSWIAMDDQTESSIQIGVSSYNLGTQVANNFTAQNNAQLQLSADILRVPVGDFTAAQGKTPKIKDTFPDVNNLMYASMIGKIPAPSLPFSATDYIKNAGAINLPRPQPQANWQGKDENKEAYKKYYELVASVESFSAYVLSNLAAENQGGNQVTALQNDLISKATEKDWLTSIGSEELGKVLRQILLYQSQSFVVQMQLLQTQKQLLTATVMNNSLLIANNNSNEVMMVMRAKGLIPGQ